METSAAFRPLRPSPVLGPSGAQPEINKEANFVCLDMRRHTFKELGGTRNDA